MPQYFPKLSVIILIDPFSDLIDAFKSHIFISFILYIIYISWNTIIANSMRIIVLFKKNRLMRFRIC